MPMKRITLHVPRLSEMKYRQRLLAQPETMGYNRGRDLGVDAYDPETGCIDFPRSDWRYWRQVWLLNEPDFYSAYLLNEEEGCFVGEACYFYDAEAQAHTAGILIEAAHRGNGYCAEGLRALADRAFRRPEVALLRCELRAEDMPAVAGYRRAGFHCFDCRDGLCTMVCTREDYERDGGHGDRPEAGGGPR